MGNTDDYVLARLASVEATITAYCKAVEEWKEANSRLGAVREQSIINSVFAAVQKAMENERENSRNLFASLEAKLSSCTTIQDSAIDIVKSDLSTARVSIESHDTWIDIHKDHHVDLEKELDAVKKTVRKMVDDPGNKAKKVLQNVGAGAIPVAGYGLYMFFKSILAGNK